MLKIALTAFGFGVVIASPVISAGESRFALIVEAPWSEGRAIEIGRRAGGVLIQSGWRNAVFYFPEGSAIPGWTADTASVPVKGSGPMCGNQRGTDFT